MSNAVVNSDFVKKGLDFAIGAMDKLNSETGVAATTVTLLGGALTGLAGMAKAGGVFDILKGLGSGMVKGFKGISSLLGLMPPQLGLIIAAVGAAALAYDHFHVSASEALEEANKLQASLAEDYGTGSRYDQLINAQQELNELEKEELRLLEAKKAAREAEAKEAEQEAFDKFQDEFEKTGFFGASTQDQMKGAFEDVSYFIRDIANGVTSTSDFEKELGNIVSDLSEGGEQLAEWSAKGYDLNETNQRLLDGYNNLTLLYADLKDGGVDAYTALGAAATYYGEAMGLSEDEAIEKSTQIVDSVRELESQKPNIDITDNAMEVRSNVDELSSAIEKVPRSVNINFSVNGSTAISSAVGMVSSFMGKKGFASGTDSAPGGPALVNELGPEIISANGKAYIAGDGEPTITNLPRGATVIPADETQEALRGEGLTSSIPAYKSGYWTFMPQTEPKVKPKLPKVTGPKLGPAFLADNPISRVGNARPVTSQKSSFSSIKNYVTGGKQNIEAATARGEAMTDYYKRLMETGKTSGSGNGHGGSGSSTPSGPAPVDIKAQTEAFKDQIKVLEHRLFLMTEEGASEAERIDQMKKIQEEIEKQKQWYYDQGEDANSKYIQDLEKQWWKYEDKIKDLYKEQAEIYDQLFGAVGEKAQDEIDALNKQKEELQNQNSELQKQIELEKALDELARARQQKKLVFKDGQMVYVEDVDAVSKAQQRIDEIQNRERQDAQIEAIDKQIAEWEKYKEAWDSVVDDYDKKQDLLLIKEKLGIDLEAENWKERLENLQVYIDKYNDLMVKGGAKDADLKARETSILPTGVSGQASEASLWSMGVATPSSMMSSVVGGIKQLGQSVGITIQNFAPNLPNVANGEDFVKYLRSNFLQQTLQFAK